MHQLRVNTFCPSLTLSPDHCTALFWPCGLQISLEPQSCKCLHVRNIAQYYQDMKDLPFHILNAEDPWSTFHSAFFTFLQFGKTTRVSNCHEGLAAACHRSGFPGAVWAVFFNLQCHGTQMREETPRNVLLELFGNRIFRTPFNHCWTWLVLQDNYQHFRGGDMWNDCALPSVWLCIFNGIEVTQFLSCWPFSTTVINGIFKVLLSYKSTAGMGEPTCSLKAWLNQRGPQPAQGIGGTGGA